MDAYEVKNQELAAENADLRALLRSMQVNDSLVSYRVFIHPIALRSLMVYMVDLRWISQISHLEAG